MRNVVRTAIALAFAASVVVPADAQMEPYKGSAEFEQLKSLIGVWEGEMPMKGKGDGEQSEEMQMMKMTVEYRLTAGGSAIQETVFRGSPMEMVSMYHDRGGRLSMTHYCMLGNQPRMDLESSGEDKLIFAFSKANDLDPSTDMHMHSMVLSFVDENKITQRWTMFEGGEAQQAHDMHLTRTQ